jgi:serine/threonine protein kinase
MKRPARLIVDESQLGSMSNPGSNNNTPIMSPSTNVTAVATTATTNNTSSNNTEFLIPDPNTGSLRGLTLPNSEELLFSLNPADLDELETIGQGACSVVKKARHKASGTLIAIKVFKLFDASRRDMLTKELHSLYKTNCPAIVRYYGAFHREGTINVALEYMDGGSLANVSEQVGIVSEFALANFAFQILWGMGYLKHEHRIHRDIKPQNILINSNGEVKLTDFGISKELLTSLAFARTFVGSFRYMAPERLENRPYTFASDLWSLGIVLYELATGRTPFATDDGTEEDTTYIGVVQAVLESETPTLPEGTYSEPFRSFMEILLNKIPEKRSSPESLLIAPWLRFNGAISIDAATANVRQWIQSLQR